MSEIHRKLEQEGFFISLSKVQTLYNNLVIDVLKSEHRDELIDSFLKNFKKVNEMAEGLVEDIKEFMKEFKEKHKETPENPYNFQNWLSLQRELKDWLVIAMKHQGEFEKNMLKIKETITIVPVEKRMEIITKNEENMFNQFNAEITKDGQIIFKDPRPEFIARLRKWEITKEERKKQKVEVNE